MNYRVVWVAGLLDRLAELYISAEPADRDRMAVGVEHFNNRLAADPLSVGESRQGNHRVAFPPLLHVYFRVDQSSRVVWITRVNRYGS